MKQKPAHPSCALLDQHQLNICARLAEGPQTLNTLQARLKRSAEQVKEDLRAIDATSLGPLMYQPKIQFAKEFGLLNKNEIYGLITKKTRDILPLTNLRVLLTVDSGNDYVKNQTSCPFIVLCEQQTAGRGRYGRSWQSPFGAGLYLSALFKLTDFQSAGTDGLSLAVGVMVARFVAKLGLEARLKWPNDLLDLKGQKLGGILIEIQEGYVVMGIGINHAEQEGLATADYSHASLCAMARAAARPRIDRNVAAAGLIGELISGLREFKRRGFQGFYAEWRARDALAAKRITAHNGKVRTGVCMGVNKQGALVLRADDGKQHIVTGGTLHAT